ncbi:MAG TPA: cupin domain-containing protein [Casimicrobiaceae bacterium]|nr:cupin domain-containing protein [Casimicrobiaceae bacterium]
MTYRETLPRRGMSRKQMLKRVARFKKLKGSDGGLPDSRMPGCERTLYNVIGFQPPEVERGGKQSPVGLEAARMAAVKISEGFNLAYCRAKPGKGPMLHNHDTNETFVAMTGKWRASWLDERGRLQHVDLQPLDLISFPPGVIRRFQNVTRGSEDKEAILMVVIAGDSPSSEFTVESMRAIERAGAMPARHRS